MFTLHRQERCFMEAARNGAGFFGIADKFLSE